MSVFRSPKAAGLARSVKAFLKPEDGSQAPEHTREAALKAKKHELREVTTELRAAKKRGDKAERNKNMKLSKRLRQEIYALQRQAEDDEPGTGALPDFSVIGGAKCGTTYFYHLMTLHPHVESPAMKEMHFFDVLYDEGVEWYRGCFPRPRLKDGRMTITGDGTPGYLFHPLVPERMAEVVPDARLISVIRNPVERAYSAYHHRVRNGNERRTFEEAVADALKKEERNPTPEERVASEREDTIRGKDIVHGFVSNSVYVDHLMHWEKYFPREQMLVVKSEDFFEDPIATLQPVFEFVGLPRWEPDSTQPVEKRKNTGGYEEKMDPETRRRLQEFFEPHNRRLYDYLGRDLGW